MQVIDNYETGSTYNWDTDHYDLGKGFGHIAIGVGDVYAACEKNQKYRR